MRNLILFSILLISSTAPAVDYTSIRALQFFNFDEKNTVGFPQEVPSKAYYTDQDYAGKELRITTNVASAVYSTISGLLERDAWMCNIHDDLSYLNNSVQWRLWWDYEIYEDQDSFIDACRYQDFNRTDTYLSTAYKYATSRYIETRRLAPATLLKDAREELILMATDTDRYDATYSHPCNISSRYLLELGFQPQEYTRFPSFDWTSNLVCTIKSETEWGDVLPTVFSAPWGDGLWKTNDVPEGTHYFSFLYPVLEWYIYFEEHYNDAWVDIEDVDWDWDATNLTWNIIRNISTQQSWTPVSWILYADFDWDYAERFTNETLRVDYYTIGTIEHAVGAIDTSYDLTEFNNDDLDVSDMSYQHKWSSYTPVEIVTTNTPTKVRNEEGKWDIYIQVQAFDDDNWKRTETWEETTNNIDHTSQHPFFTCTGDEPAYNGFLDARTDHFRLSFEGLVQEMDFLGTDTLRFNLSQPDIDVSGTKYIVDFGDIVMEKESVHGLRGSASVSRRTRVRHTLPSIATNAVGQQYFSRPSKFAFDWGMIDNVYSQSLQTRLLIVDPDITEYDTDLTWEQGTGAVWRAECRSSYLGTFQTWDSLVDRWLYVSPNLNSALESILPYQVRPRDFLLPLGVNELKKMENEVAGGGGMKMNFSSTDGKARVYTVNADRSQINVIVERDDGFSERILYPGETDVLGAITGGTNTTVDVDRRISRRRPFHAEGHSTGLHTTRWKFNSIRPDSD